MRLFLKMLGQHAVDKVLFKKKETVDQTSFTVRLFNNKVLEKIDTFAKSTGYTRNELVNMILDKFVKESEMAIIDEDEEREATLYFFKELDRYLFATLDREILIGLTLDEVGRETKKYLLRDYNLSYTNQHLTLKLERNGDRYPITFHGIEDVRFNDLESRLKTWLYMKNNWRFYLYFDRDKLEKLPDEFISNKLTLPCIPIYGDSINPHSDEKIWEKVVTIRDSFNTPSTHRVKKFKALKGEYAGRFYFIFENSKDNGRFILNYNQREYIELYKQIEIDKKDIIIYRDGNRMGLVPTEYRTM